MPSLVSCSWLVVPTDTESNTASTATPMTRFCSISGTPSRSKVRRISGSTSSRDAGRCFSSTLLGAE